MEGNDYLRPSEVAKRLRLHVRSVYRLLAQGKLAGLRRGAGGGWLVPREAVEGYLVAGRGPAPLTASAREDYHASMARLRAKGVI